MPPDLSEPGPGPVKDLAGGPGFSRNLAKDLTAHF